MKIEEKIIEFCQAQDCNFQDLGSHFHTSYAIVGFDKCLLHGKEKISILYLCGEINALKLLFKIKDILNED